MTLKARFCSWTHSINNMSIGAQGFKYAIELPIELFTDITVSTVVNLMD